MLDLEIENQNLSARVARLTRRGDGGAGLAAEELPGSE